MNIPASATAARAMKTPSARVNDMAQDGTMEKNEKKKKSEPGATRALLGRRRDEAAKLRRRAIEDNPS